MHPPSAATLDDLRDIFGAALYAAAQRLIDGGCVIEVRVLNAGSTITGIANDPPHAQSRSRHRVYIQCRSDPRQPELQIEGECSCGKRAPCVHVAAVCMAAASNATGTTASATAHREVSPSRIEPASQRPVSPTISSAPAQQIYYLLTAVAGGRAESYELSAWVAQSAAGGRRVQSESACVFVPRPSGHGEFPRYVSAADRDILKALLTQASTGPWELRDAAGASLLRQAVATGRAYWRTFDGQPLGCGDDRSALCSWEVLPNGEQYLHCTAATPLEILLGVDPIQYVDAATNECGSLNLPCAAGLFRRYRNDFPIAPERVAAVNEEIVQHAQGADFPRLRTIAVQRQARTDLRARLVLSAGPQATLHFIYNDLPIAPESLRAQQDMVRAMLGDVLHEIERDHDGEARLRSRVQAALEPATLGRPGWLAFMADTVPALQADGWEVIAGDDFPYRIATADDWYSTLESSTTRASRKDAAREWFDLRLGILVEGRPINLLPVLAAYLQNTLSPEQYEYCLVGDHLFVRLDDGRYARLTMERVERIAATLVELFEHDSLNVSQALRLPRCQAARLAQLFDESGPLPKADDASLATLIEGLKQFTAIEPLPAPAGFQGTLRSYQQEGLGWLQFLRRYRLGGILADDMGLGKTAQALAHLSFEKAQGRLEKPALIVAPVSVIGNWQREIRRFAPDLELLTLHGPRRKESFHAIGRSDIVVTGYPLLQLDSEILLAHEFSFVILDEAQTIKNPRAKVSQVARELRAEHRLCLTGTPLENHLGELWSLFEFLQPGLLGNEPQFQRLYRTPIEKESNTQRASALARRIAPFVLRRTKDAVARELPAKTQIVETIVLEERQRDLYDSIRLSMHGKVREIIQQQGLARSHLTVLDALLKLRQVCCDPRLVPDAQAQDIPSAKLEWLSTMLPELIEEGRRILLFSQFTSMLALIEAALVPLGIPYCLLTGATRDRTAQVERFQSRAAPLFLISLKAGGTGLNLTAADTVIHYDPWWNPAVEAQATDRAHRIGQDKPVFVYKLIAANTVEEKIMQLQSGKQTLASQLYTEKAAAPTQLNSEDLEALFAP